MPWKNLLLASVLLGRVVSFVFHEQHAGGRRIVSLHLADTPQQQREELFPQVPTTAATTTTPRSSTRSLNSELFTLRKRPKGIPEAERRLEVAIQHMLEDPKASKRLVQTKTDTDLLAQLPDTVSFNSILSAHARNVRRDPMSPQFAERLLRKMEELAQSFPHLSPTIFTYNSAMETFSKTISSKDARKRQQSQLSTLRLYRELNKKKLSPNTYTYNLVLTSNAQSSPEWKQVEAWALDHLDNKGHKTTASIKDSSDELIPDRQTYNQLLRSYAATGQPDKAERVLVGLLEATKEGGHLDPSAFQVTTVWFNLVLNAISKTTTRTPSSGKQADKLLNMMVELRQQQQSSSSATLACTPDTSTYNHMLNVHATLGNATRAEQLVKELEQKCANNHDGSVHLSPDVVTFTTLIKAYAQAQQQQQQQQRHHISTTAVEESQLAEKASAALAKMILLSKAGWPNLNPTVKTYNSLLHIWAQVGSQGALHKMMEVFRQMKTASLLPDSVTYSTMICGWARVKRLVRSAEAGKIAEQLLRELEQLPPSRIRHGFRRTSTYNAVITAWSKSGDVMAAQKAESLLSQLENKYFNGYMDAQPDKTTFLCVIGAYAKAEIPDAEERCEALLQRMMHFRDVFQLDSLKPDKIVYNGVLNALAKSGRAGAEEKAEEILAMMQASQDPELRPDIVTYATVIDCFTKCGTNSDQRAEELLRFVEGSYRAGDMSLEPNAVFYSGILQAWAKSATVEGATKAEELLRRNLGLYQQGHMYAKPHSILYNAVMDAIARAGGPDAGCRAEELLREMETMYQETGDDQMKPSRRSYNACILAYRHEPGGGRKAESLLERMEDLADNHGRFELKPDVVTYNCVIGSIVEEQGDENVADRAQALLDRMEERRVEPDGRTYSPVIEAWLKRNDEKGHRLAEIMLQQFVAKVEKSKSKLTKQPFQLYEESVWEVVNAYPQSKDR